MLNKKRTLDLYDMGDIVEKLQNKFLKNGLLVEYVMTKDLTRLKISYKKDNVIFDHFKDILKKDKEDLIIMLTRKINLWLELINREE